MKVLERHLTYGPFLERLRSAPARVLLLDYDGTLAPFVVDRTLALPYPEVPPLIVRIMAQGTRVVLISGRPVRELLLLSGISPQPEAHILHRLQSTERARQAARLDRIGIPAHGARRVIGDPLLRERQRGRDRLMIRSTPHLERFAAPRAGGEAARRDPVEPELRAALGPA